MTAVTLGVGVHRNVPADVYHALPYASNSRLSKLRRSPAHLRAYMDQPGESTTALRIGRAAHTSILEPDLFDREFVTAEQCSGIKKDGDRCANSGVVLTELDGWRCGVHIRGTTPSLDPRIVVKTDDLATCRGMRAAVLAHPLASSLLRAASDTELTLVWDDPETGVRCKARPDLYAPEIMDGLFGDLKSCEDARADSFSRSVVSYGYAMQCAHYLDGAAVLRLPVYRFVFFSVEKAPPHGVCLYELSQDDLIMAREQVHRLLCTWAMCAERSEWPGYPAEVKTLFLPPWAWRAAHEPLTTEAAGAF